METIIIQATHETPFAHLDPNSGEIEFRGRSIPTEPDAFWAPILKWFDAYVENPKKNTVLKLDFEYFNISSSKRILFLLYKLNELSESGNSVSVEWHYRQNDEDMFEVGQDYAFMVKVPFHFMSYHEADIAV